MANRTVYYTDSSYRLQVISTNRACETKKQKHKEGKKQKYDKEKKMSPFTPKVTVSVNDM